MNLETTEKAAYLWRDLRKAEDRIKFLKQFVPKEKSDRRFLFPSRKVNPPQFEIVTITGEGESFFSVDDEMTSLIIQALEAKRDKFLKEIDAL